MSRTFRNKRPKFNLGERLAKLQNKDGSVRDGTPTHSTASCQHHGGCPWCEGNRTFNLKKTVQVIED